MSLRIVEPQPEDRAQRRQRVAGRIAVAGWIASVAVFLGLVLC